MQKAVFLTTRLNNNQPAQPILNSNFLNTEPWQPFNTRCEKKSHSLKLKIINILRVKVGFLQTLQKGQVTQFASSAPTQVGDSAKTENKNKNLEDHNRSTTLPEPTESSNSFTVGAQAYPQNSYPLETLF